MKRGCVLCRCWQELCRKRCAHTVKREHPAGFHLHNELLKSETREYGRCDLILTQRFLGRWYRKLERLPDDSLFACVGMAMGVFSDYWICLLRNSNGWREKAGKGKQ